MNKRASVNPSPSTRATLELLVCVFLGLLGGVGSLPAQEPAQCEEGRIARVDVHSQRVFADSAAPLLEKVYAIGNWLHVETTEEFIRRELLFAEGDCLDRFKLRESERLLRLFAFLQSASVQAVRRADGDFDVQVITQDDWSLRLEPRFDLERGPMLSGIALAERNIAGSGRALEVSYLDRSDRTEVGVAFFDPQSMKTRWNLSLAAAHSESGWVLYESVSYPFVGLVGRRASFEELRYGELWFHYIMGDERRRRELTLPYTHALGQLGGALRLIAPPRDGMSRQGTYGASLSYERLSHSRGFSDDTVDFADPRLASAAAGDLGALGLRDREALRLNLLFGVRSLRFIQRNGVKTLKAREDVGLGAEAGFMLGVARRGFGSSDSHVLGAVDLYGGARIRGGWFSLLRFNLEGRRSYEAGRWEDIFCTVQWSNYWLLNARNTMELAAQWSAGWEATIPFQLTLGGAWGVAGFESHRYPGGSRLTARLEDRHSLASVGRLFDLGTVAFLDMGQMWENGALFGTDSGLRASLGGGIRIASPSGTRLVYRLQVAAPLHAATRLGEPVFSFRIDRFLGFENQPVDFQLDRSRDVASRSVVQQLR